MDAIWLSPIHPSPNRDWGYDVSDYEGVHPDYGTLDGFRRAGEAAHARGLKIILDEVLATPPTNMPGSPPAATAMRRKTDWYVWADPQGRRHGAQQLAVGVRRAGLGLSAGAAAILPPQIPAPAAQAELANRGGARGGAEVLDLWLERGVDGFRLDVANAFLHDATLTDNPAIPAGERAAAGMGGSGEHAAPSPRLQSAENSAVLDVIRRRVEAFDDRFVFGEFSEEFERSGCYLPPDEGLHAGYNFALLLASDCGRRSARISKRWRAIPITGRASPSPTMT